MPGSQADSSGGPELHCPCATTAELEVSKYLWTEDGTLQRVAPTVVPVITPGTLVYWTYELRNLSTVVVAGTDLAMLITSLVDDAGTPYDPLDDFVPVYVSGDTDADGLLDVGEIWVFTSRGVITYRVVPGPYTNTVTAQGAAADGCCGVATAFSSHVGTVVVTPPDPAVVQVVKLVNGSDANDAPGVAVTAGSAVTWTYRVSNTGQSPATGVGLVDDNGTPNNPADDFVPTYLSGDLNGNGLLDVGETWLYTASGVAISGLYCNTATVSATGVASDTDPACYTGSVVPLPPVVKVVKLVNGQDANTAPGVAVTTRVDGDVDLRGHQHRRVAGVRGGVGRRQRHPEQQRGRLQPDLRFRRHEQQRAARRGRDVAVHGLRDRGGRAVLQRRDCLGDGCGQRPRRGSTPRYVRRAAGGRVGQADQRRGGPDRPGAAVTAGSTVTWTYR